MSFPADATRFSQGAVVRSPEAAPEYPATIFVRGWSDDPAIQSDRVTWNSEAGRVSGTIMAVRTRDFDLKGYTHHPSQDDPQYEIRSDKTDHVAAHKGSALDYV